MIAGPIIETSIAILDSHVLCDVVCSPEMKRKDEKKKYEIFKGPSDILCKVCVELEDVIPALKPFCVMVC